MPPPVPTEAPKNGPPHKPTLAELAQSVLADQPVMKEVQTSIGQMTVVGMESTAKIEEPEEKEEEHMDAEKMQRDRDAGMSVKDIAKKYDCHPASVYNNTHASKRVSAPKKDNLENDVPSAVGGIAGAIASLEQERARLTAELERIGKAIETLKGL